MISFFAFVDTFFELRRLLPGGRRFLRVWKREQVKPKAVFATWPFYYDDVIKKVVATKTFWPLQNIIKETFVTSQLWRLPCTKSAFFCQFEAFKGRIHWFSLHRQLQCSTAVKRTLPPWNLVDYSSQEIHFCGQKTGTKTATPSGRHRPRNQSSKKDFTIFPYTLLCRIQVT